jgi:threonine aldolase
MANQIALKVHCQPGDDVVIGEGAHNALYESGAAGAIAGVQFTVVGRGGLYTVKDLEAAFKPGDNHSYSPTRLVCVENTHNRGGGVVWPQRDVAEVAAFAKGRGIPTHLDGARLCNAAVAQGVSAAELAAPFDTVSMCFSKGLGAPVGSVIAGARPLMVRAHRFRKMLGGGMRQAGILAAAALHALDTNVERLADDHANARLLAERLSEVPGLSVNLEKVQTNIVMVDLATWLPAGPEASAALKAAGVLCLPVGAAAAAAGHAPGCGSGRLRARGEGFCGRAEVALQRAAGLREQGGQIGLAVGGDLHGEELLGAAAEGELVGAAELRTQGVQLGAHLGEGRLAGGRAQPIVDPEQELVGAEAQLAVERLLQHGGRVQGAAEGVAEPCLGRGGLALAAVQQPGAAVGVVDEVVAVVADEGHAGALGDVGVVGHVDEQLGELVVLDPVVEDGDEAVGVGDVAVDEQLHLQLGRVHGVTRAAGAASEAPYFV